MMHPQVKCLDSSSPYLKMYILVETGFLFIGSPLSQIKFSSWGQKRSEILVFFSLSSDIFTARRSTLVGQSFKDNADAFKVVSLPMIAWRAMAIPILIRAIPLSNSTTNELNLWVDKVSHLTRIAWLLNFRRNNLCLIDGKKALATTSFGKEIEVIKCSICYTYTISYFERMIFKFQKFIDPNSW